MFNVYKFSSQNKAQPVAPADRYAPPLSKHFKRKSSKYFSHHSCSLVDEIAQGGPANKHFICIVLCYMRWTSSNNG
jgi:hypothetical protein